MWLGKLFAHHAYGPRRLAHYLSGYFGGSICSLMRSDMFCICCPQLLQKTWARVPHRFGHTVVAPLTSPTRCTSMPTSWPPTCPSRPQRPALLTRPQCQGSMRWVKMSCDLGSFCLFISWVMASVSGVDEVGQDVLWFGFILSLHQLSDGLNSAGLMLLVLTPLPSHTWNPVLCCPATQVLLGEILHCCQVFWVDYCDACCCNKKKNQYF